MSLDILKQLLGGLCTLVWPEGCVICGEKSDALICHRCFKKGKLEESAAVMESNGGVPIISFGRADGPWRKVVHGLKYNSQHRWPVRLLQIAAPDQLPLELGSSLCWLPVPLHHSRLRERGYNQAELIAKAAASIWGGRVERKLLKRIKKSVSQTKLSAEERKKNVSSQFVVRSFFPTNKLQNESIILVDDVVTTGATLDSCRSALLSVGLEVKAAITLLRAELSQDDCEGELWESGG